MSSISQSRSVTPAFIALLILIVLHGHEKDWKRKRIIKKIVKEFPDFHNKLENLKEFKSMLNKEILDLEKKLKELYE
jgi:hypothetical protein